MARTKVGFLQEQKTKCVGSFDNSGMHMQTDDVGFLRRSCKAILLIACIVNASCGGGGSADAGGGQPVPPEVANPIGPGHFESATFIKTISASDVMAALPTESLTLIKPLYSVDTYKIIYTTTDANGRNVIASGLTAIPRKSTQLGSPVMSYQHATVKTDSGAPSNHATADEPAVLFASLGYLVSATDYVGYGASKGLPHPYLLAAPTAASVVDFMTASARWRKMQAIADNGQLFLTGYSEGAYATMATQRLLTQNASQLPTMTYVGAGPYDVAITLNSYLDIIRQQNLVLGLLVNPGFLKNLGATDRNNLRNLFLFAVLGSQSDVSFDATFLDNFLNDDVAAIASQSSVFDWTPKSAISFFHGRDDTTVSYANTDAIFRTMNNRGAGALIDRLDCPAKPAEHIPCVPSFLVNDIARLGAVAKGL